MCANRFKSHYGKWLYYCARDYCCLFRIQIRIWFYFKCATNSIFGPRNQWEQCFYFYFVSPALSLSLDHSLSMWQKTCCFMHLRNHTIHVKLNKQIKIILHTFFCTHEKKPFISCKKKRRKLRFHSINEIIFFLVIEKSSKATKSD